MDELVWTCCSLLVGLQQTLGSTGSSHWAATGRDGPPSTETDCSQKLEMRLHKRGEVGKARATVMHCATIHIDQVGVACMHALGL